MSVKIGPAYSIVIAKDSLRRIGKTIRDFDQTIGNSLISEDEHLMVLGPFYEPEETLDKLSALGLEYFDDYFDLTHNGGTVPDWCQISLEYKNPQ